MAGMANPFSFKSTKIRRVNPGAGLLVVTRSSIPPKPSAETQIVTMIKASPYTIDHGHAGFCTALSNRVV